MCAAFLMVMGQHLGLGVELGPAHPRTTSGDALLLTQLELEFLCFKAQDTLTGVLPSWVHCLCRGPCSATPAEIRGDTAVTIHEGALPERGLLREDRPSPLRAHTCTPGIR